MKPTIGDTHFSAFVDLTARPDSIRIADAADGGHTLHFASYEPGAHITLYLSPGSLAALRFAAGTHLDGGA